jgi:hypothetical protein
MSLCLYVTYVYYVYLTHYMCIWYVTYGIGVRRYGEQTSGVGGRQSQTQPHRDTDTGSCGGGCRGRYVTCFTIIDTMYHNNRHNYTD